MGMHQQRECWAAKPTPREETDVTNIGWPATLTKPLGDLRPLSPTPEWTARFRRVNVRGGLVSISLGKEEFIKKNAQAPS